MAPTVLTTTIVRSVLGGAAVATLAGADLLRRPSAPGLNSRIRTARVPVQSR